MANNTGSVDEIIGQKGIDSVDIAIKKLEALFKSLEQTANGAKLLNDALNYSGNGGAGKAAKDIDILAKANQDLIKVTQQMQVAQHSVFMEKELAKQQNAELTKQNALHVKMVNAEVGSYDEMQAKLSQLTMKYKAMGAAQREAMGKDTLANIQKYEKGLQDIDKTMGKFNRNVGNYQNQTFQLSQVFREIPAFTYSATTGILALSNNLPMLADGFKQVATATNDATGKVNGTMGALKIFAKSIFSWTNAFTIAIGLIAIFSKEIMEFINGTDEAAESLKAMRDASDDAVGKVGELRESLELAQKGVITKTEFTKRYNEVLGDSAGKTDDFNIASQNTIDKSDAYIQMIKLRANAQRLLKIAIDKSNEATDIQNDSQGNWTMLKAQASYSWNNFLKSGNVASLFSGMANPDKAYDFYLEQYKEEEKAAELAWKTEFDKLEEFKKQNQLDAENKKTKKSKEPKHDIEPQLQTLKVMKTNLKKFEPELSKEMKEQLERALAIIEDGIKNHPIKIVWDWQDTLAEYAQALNEIFRTVTATNQQLANAASDIGDIVLAKELERIEKRNKALDESYKNEIRFIEQTGLSQEKKEKMRRQLDAETEAKQKQIDKDRITALRKRAQLQKAIDVNMAISNTVLAVTGALSRIKTDGWAAYAEAIAVGIAGAIQVAKIIATPLPQYAKGRKGGKAEFAEVNELGAEVVRLQDGTSYVPNEGKRGVTFLPQGAEVIPHHDLIKQAAYVQLASQGVITTDKMQAALIESYERNTAELIGLRQDLRNKKFRADVNTLSSYNQYKEGKIK